MSRTHQMAAQFKRKFPGTIAWRIKSHSKIIDKFINPGEELRYVFACQKNSSSLDMFSTYVVAVTNKRIMIAQKRLLFGYLYVTITPELYNDVKIAMGIIWGKIRIDTVKELVELSNIDKKALPELETAITTFMTEAKRKVKSEKQEV